MKKFKLNRRFQIQISPSRVKTYFPGVFVVPDEMTDYHALRASQMRLGEFLLVEKKAPENKVVDAAENKAEVVKKRRGRPRAKPDA